MICVMYLKNCLNVITRMWWAWLENKSSKEQKLRAVTTGAMHTWYLAKHPWHGKQLWKNCYQPFKKPFLFQQQKGKGSEAEASVWRSWALTEAENGISWGKSIFTYRWRNYFKWFSLDALALNQCQWLATPSQVPVPTPPAAVWGGGCDVGHSIPCPASWTCPHWVVRRGPVQTAVEINAVKLLQKQHPPRPKPQPASGARQMQDPQHQNKAQHALYKKVVNTCWTSDDGDACETETRISGGASTQTSQN